MGREFTRQELYELVWSQPMKMVAASAGVSDVALAKACRRADIPVPERGYWARKQAGKQTVQRPLPLRFPGASDQVEVGQGRWSGYGTPITLDTPVPAPPTFDESMQALTDRVRGMVGKVTCPRLLNRPHRLIAEALEKDERRREEKARTGYSWDAPLYETPLEKRRLRILNAIFLATERAGCKPSFKRTRYSSNDETAVQVGSQHISFILEKVPVKKGRKVEAEQKERLQLIVPSHSHNAPVLKRWEDADDATLEDLVGTIAVDLIIAAEVFHRENVTGHHRWLVERRAQLEEEARRRTIEEERKERERREAEEKDRIDRLLAQATALQQANTIRAYVQAVLDRMAEMPVAPDEVERWAMRAMREADRIDPVKNGSVLAEVSVISCSAGLS